MSTAKSKPQYALGTTPKQVSKAESDDGKAAQGLTPGTSWRSRLPNDNDRLLHMPFRVHLLGAVCASLFLNPVFPQDAEALRSRYAALSEQLADSPFGRPLYLESSHRGGDWNGQIHAAVARPYLIVARALRGPQPWCDILILQTNVKYCEASIQRPTDKLAVHITRKHHDRLEDAYTADFRFQVIAAQDDYLHVVLTSPDGPFGTKDYRIELEAAPLDSERTFLHMAYSYTLGLTARLAVRSYLATAGSDKVGFSIVKRRADGRPVYVGGIQGMIERNTMRYYLAIEAYLGALDVPLAEQPERRLRDWYAAIERYPRQLLEMERDAYLQMKRREVKRQQAASKDAAG